MKKILLSYLLACAPLLSDQCTATPPVPQEYQSSYECRQRIREAAHQLRHLVETRVREEIPGAFKKVEVLRKLYPIIDELEWNALENCRKGQTAVCSVVPLVEQFNKWNSEGFIKYASST